MSANRSVPDDNPATPEAMMPIVGHGPHSLRPWRTDAPRSSPLRADWRADDGFTLIELLVVILIIGILAAIALPNFLGQRERAYDTSALSNVHNGATFIEACYMETGNYGNCGTVATAGTGLTTGWAPDGVTVGVIYNINGAFTIWSKSQSGTTFRYNRGVWGDYNRSCDRPGTGRCNGSGSWS